MKKLKMSSDKSAVYLHDPDADIYVRYDKSQFNIEIYDAKHDVYWEDVDQDIQDIFIKIISKEEAGDALCDHWPFGMKL
jgi:hypothetical protein